MQKVDSGNSSEAGDSTREPGAGDRAWLLNPKQSAEGRERGGSQETGMSPGAGAGAEQRQCAGRGAGPGPGCPWLASACCGVMLPR